MTAASLAVAIASADAAPVEADGGAAGPRSGPVITVGVPSDPSVMAGFDRALLAELARDRGVGVAWVDAPSGTALRGLEAGTFDLAAGPFSARQAAGYRLLPPVAATGDALLKRRGDGAVLKPADMAGKAIGLLNGAADPVRLRALTALLHARPALRSTLGTAEGDLAAGRLAALAGPLPEVAAAALARPETFEVVGPPFGATARLAPAMRATPDSSSLAGTLGAALGRMRADGRLAALQRQWFGLVFDPPDATAGPPAPTPAGPSRP